MSKEELKEKMLNYSSQLNGLIELCKGLGNNDYENNVLVKDMFEKYLQAKKEYEEAN